MLALSHPGSARGWRSRAAGCFVALALLAGCSGSTSSSSSHALGLRVDGTLDPHDIHLGGVQGVSARQQSHAENLLQHTIVSLARWNDLGQALRDGFEPLQPLTSVLTGADIHLVHWDWIDDDDVLDPNRPESLVYKRLADGHMELEGAMYILPSRYTLANAPDVGGKLVQYHTHNKLCFTPFPHPRFKQLARFTDGACPRPLIKLLTNLMIHVWIRPNPCGPFAPIGGFAGGVVAPGETALCDRLHGGPED